MLAFLPCTQWLTAPTPLLLPGATHSTAVIPGVQVSRRPGVVRNSQATCGGAERITPARPPRRSAQAVGAALARSLPGTAPTGPGSTRFPATGPGIAWPGPRSRTAGRRAGRLGGNSADVRLPALSAGVGVAVRPEFLLRSALAGGTLQIVLPEWQLPAGAVYWLAPPGGPRPRRVAVLADFLAEHLGRRA